MPRKHTHSLLVKKVYYGRKKGKVIPIYGHKISKRIGRHRFYITWKTTKKICQEKHIMGHFTKHERKRKRNASSRAKDAQNVGAATNAAGDDAENNISIRLDCIFLMQPHTK